MSKQLGWSETSAGGSGSLSRHRRRGRGQV